MLLVFVGASVGVGVAGCSLVVGGWWLVLALLVFVVVVMDDGDGDAGWRRW